MTSTKKAEANKRNAKKSTGPRTAFGKSQSSRNAIRHALSASDERVETNQELIRDIIGLLIKDIETSGPLEFYAREVALSLLELSRVKAAKTKVWNLVSSDLSAKSHGVLYEYLDLLPSVWPKQLEKMWRQQVPEAFEKPFDSENERSIAIYSIAAEKLNKLIRYERRAANRRNRAVRAFNAEQLALAKAMETQPLGSSGG